MKTSLLETGPHPLLPEACLSGQYCTRCRNRDLGCTVRSYIRIKILSIGRKPFQISVQKLPEDFECPNGLEWGFTAKQTKATVVIPMKSKQTTELVEGGPGTFMYGSLKLLKLVFRKECKCKDRAKIMNDRGVDWCEQNQETILEWLRKEANNQGIFFIESIAQMLIRHSIKKARKWAERNHKDDI